MDQSAEQSASRCHMVQTNGVSTYKANRIRVETARDRVHHGEFAESIDDVENHDTHDGKANEQRRWTTFSQCASGADKEASSNGTTNGDHVEMARLHGAVQLINSCSPVTYTGCQP
jgi:hypothetical protein